MPVLSASATSLSDPEPRSILIWRTGALGDTLLTIPALRVLRGAFPQARLIFVGTFPQAQLLGQPYGSATQVLDAGRTEWSALFDPTMTQRAELTNLLAGVDGAVIWSAQAEQIAAGFARIGIRSLVATAALPSHTMSVAEYLIGTLSRIPLVATDSASACARLDLPSEYTASMHVSSPEPYIVLHPGGGGRHKRWPLAAFMELARRFDTAGYGVVWTLGPADEAERVKLTHVWREPEQAVWDNRPLDDLIGLLHQSALTVAGDTGIAHLAAAVDCPTLILFGPTDPQVWAPRCPHVSVVRPAQSCGLCAPESGPGGRGRASDCTCLAALTVEQVQERALELIGHHLA